MRLLLLLFVSAAVRAGRIRSQLLLGKVHASHLCRLAIDAPRQPPRILKPGRFSGSIMSRVVLLLPLGRTTESLRGSKNKDRMVMIDALSEFHQFPDTEKHLKVHWPRNIYEHQSLVRIDHSVHAPMRRIKDSLSVAGEWLLSLPLRKTIKQLLLLKGGNSSASSVYQNSDSLWTSPSVPSIFMMNNKPDLKSAESNESSQVDQIVDEGL